MSEENSITVSNEEEKSLNVEISCQANNVDINYTKNFEAALSAHDTKLSSHQYLIGEIDKKVDKVIGKSLSTNDFTNELKATYDGYSNLITADTTNIGNLSTLTTTAKDTLVASINEINTKTTQVIATQTEAETGTDDTKFMTPLKTLQSIDKNAGGALK